MSTKVRFNSKHTTPPVNKVVFIFCFGSTASMVGQVWPKVSINFNPMCMIIISLLINY